MGTGVDVDAEGRLQRDRVTGKLVLVAPDRLQRPGRSRRPRGDDGQHGRCPFCPGNEDMTPPEVDALRAADSRPDAPGWRVRVVPNLYPALPGGHEVIVHSPDHARELEELDEEDAAAVVEMYRRRLHALLERGAAAVVVICNRGAHAGASIDHPHSQVFALPVVPPLLVEELADLERYRNRYGDCLLCLEIEQARREARMVIDERVAAWVPAAPRWDYGLRVAPVEHQPDFRAADVAATAAVLRRALAAVGAVTGGAPLNYWLHTVPPEHRGAYHWHIELAPRTSVTAGFEFATDMTIVEVEADAAAQSLRRALSG